MINKTILLITMLIAHYLTAQPLDNSSKKDFEGLWVPVSNLDSSWYTVITYNDKKDNLSMLSWSFIDNSSIQEKIIRQNNSLIVTKLKSNRKKWKLNIDYILINDTLMLTTWKGSASNKVLYRKLFN